MNKNPVGHPKSFTNAQELWDRCNDYFREWEERLRPLTVVGLAVYLNVSRQTLSVYESGAYDDKNNQYSDTIKKAKDYIECMKWEGALTGRYEKAVAIFDLKVNHRCIEPEKVNKAEQDDDIQEQDDVEDLTVLTFEELVEYERLRSKTTSIKSGN